ncbi:MAG: czcC 3 [Cyanobacteria bacterium RYN_339]|nr:czcC 3 [Cyanobacteria bacterium RYN_339]
MFPSASPILAVLIAAAPVAVAPEGRALGLADCLRLVVAQNPDVAADRLDVAMGRLDFESARHKYGLFLTAGPDLTRSIRPTGSSFLSGGVSQLQELDQTYKLALRQDLTTGGNLSLSFQNGVVDTNSKSVDINPAFTPTASLNFSQPLLRDFLSGSQAIEIARVGAQQADLRGRDKLIKSVADAETAYWQLVAARKEIEVRERSLVLVKDLVRIDKEKAKAGLLARLDVLQAEASLAVRESTLLASRRTLAKAEDKLRAMIDPALASPAWDDGITPSDAPTFRPRPVSFAASWQTAQERRGDLATSVLERTRTQTMLDQAGNHLWPRLDLQGGAGVTNLGNSLTGAVSDLPTLKNYDLRAGVALNWPLGHSSEQDEYHKSQLRAEQSGLNERSTRQRAYVEVRDAVRDVEIDTMRVAATKLARELADAKLDAEQAKLKAGLSTNFEVLKFQEDFEQASLEEVQATIEFLQAETRLEQVQGTLLENRGLVVVDAAPAAMTYPEPAK